MTKRPSPQLYTIHIPPLVLQQFDALPPRAARAAQGLLRTGMREHPERLGVRLRGHGMKGLLIAKRADFEITYKIDHAAHTVSILLVEPR